MSDYHEMELSRRSIQISDLREDLQHGLDRIQSAEDRSSQLERQIGKLKVEISIRKVKAQEMEDEVLADEAACQQHQQLMREDAEAFQAQRAQLQRSGAAAAAALARAEAEAADARREAEAKRREAQRLAEEEATRASQLVLLEKALEELGAELHNLQESTHSLEVTLDMEKTSSKGLEDSVADAEEKRRGSERECQRLSELLESLSVSGSNLASLAKAVSAKQQEQLQLTQELANKKRDALLQTQSIQGRLDETRMLKDQLSEARGTDAPNDTCAAELLALTASLAEARGKAEEARSRRQQLEAEATELERQLEAQGSQQQNQDNMDKEQSASLEQDLRAAQEQLDEARRRLREQDEAVQLGRRAVTEERQEASHKLQVLRSKLRQLWQAVEA
ncbi:unnamed protein product [Effrenium voratum]|nr:unnamed protein product [Effrenium voratum]CAJ1422717.1 unnamed protein product [Effrenium voratum]